MYVMPSYLCYLMLMVILFLFSTSFIFLEVRCNSVYRQNRKPIIVSCSDVCNTVQVVSCNYMQTARRTVMCC